MNQQEICKAEVRHGVKCGRPAGHEGEHLVVCTCGYVVPKGSDGWHSLETHRFGVSRGRA